MKELNFRSDIQGLRAIAVLAVMAFHFNPALLPGGFIGVDVFLVISGFLITSILLKKKNQPDYSLGTTLKYFYSSRFKRIAPAYFVMLLLTGIAASVFFTPKDFYVFKSSLEKAIWFNSNNYFASFGDYFAPANHELPLLHTWSLAVEIQFYLLIPLLVLVLSEKILIWVVLGLLILLTALAEYNLRALGIEQATYYSLYARIPEFLAGSLVAIFMLTSRRKRMNSILLSNLGVGIILIAAFLQPSAGVFPGLSALLPVIGCVLVLISTASETKSKFLSQRWIVWLGALSYSLYLWHWPVLAFIRYYTGTQVISFEACLLFVSLTLLFSVVSYYGVERFFQSKNSDRKKIFAWGLLTTSVVMVPQVMAKVNTEFTPKQLPIEYRRYADPALICHGKIVGECLRGDLKSDKMILVLGDSHAAMLNHFFDYLGKELGFKARVITASSCVTITGFNYMKIAEWARGSCLNQIKEVNEYLRESDIVFIAGMWSYHISDEKFNDTISNFILGLNDKSIFLMPQVPLMKLDPDRVRRFESLGLEGKLELSDEYVFANRSISNLADSFGNSKFVGIGWEKISSPSLCAETKLYLDKSHLNEIGSRCYAIMALGSMKHYLGNVQ